MTSTESALPAGPVLVLPGLWNSGPDHWQSHWERLAPAVFSRLVHQEWERPAAEDWTAELEAGVAQAGPGVLLAAHSLSCALVARWARRTSLSVRGALLVAPSDVE